MAENRGDYQKLPPGWDCKYDQLSGKCYYINYLTKAMQLEDPRIRYKQLQNERCSTESIPMQPMHGSPYHVYPVNNFPAAIRAFQGPNPSLQNISASPLLSSKTQQQLEMSPILLHGSPQTTPKSISVLQRQQQLIQETSFTNQIETDAVVAKINNMFPTASENHIRLLLKKYYNREAVVISALQVEKHPLTMPGPVPTPPSQRHLFHSNSQLAFQMTPPARRLEMMSSSSQNGSPIPPQRPASVSSGLLYGSPRIGEQIRNSPKPHSSPKMKLRYLKSVFPKADETLLFDILANSDNNVQKSSEKLIAMGYTKRDMAQAPKISDRKQQMHGGIRDAEQIIPLQPKILTAEDKNAIKTRLQSRYSNIAERIILMALESVDYAEDRASQILEIVQAEDASKAQQKSAIDAQKQTKEGVSSKENLEVVTESNLNDVKTHTGLIKASPSSSSAQIIMKSSSDPQKTQSQTSLMSSIQKKSDIRERNEITSKDSTLDIKDSSIEAVVTSTPTITSSSLESVSSTIVASPTSIGYHTDAKNHKLTRSRSKAKFGYQKSTPRVSTEDEPVDDFHSILGRFGVTGANPELCKGPDDDLLLADYVIWNGANPEISQGRKGLAVGSDPALRTDRNYSPIGHNSELCKGPEIGRAKGSIYSQMNRNVKCN